MWIDDTVMQQCQKSVHTEVWIPSKPLVVLGSSNRAEVECKQDHCQQDHVPILKRYGGGGTVVLYSGCVVLSVGTWVKQYFANDIYFDRLNSALIEALAEGEQAFADLEQGGISDIKFTNKKVAGTSLFRSRNYLLYQASIIVDLNFDMIEHYLRHPSKEPAYRQGRSHRNFLTSLSEIVPGTSTLWCRDVLQKNMHDALLRQLDDELLPPQTDQFNTILQRASAATASITS